MRVCRNGSPRAKVPHPWVSPSAAYFSRPYPQSQRDALDPRSHSLVELGRALRGSGYEFVTTTPESHRRVVERRGGPHALARTPRDVFGWNLWFEPDLLPNAWLALLRSAEAVQSKAGLFRAEVRFSTCARHLLVHSAAPTNATDSVFLGPDTYRFCSLLQRLCPRAKVLVDVGCGSGAGGFVVRDRAERVVLCDINARALEFSRANAALNEVNVETVQSDILRQVHGAIDVVVANPPYLRDPLQRQYRDGGGAHGEGLAVRIVEEALARLEPHGTLLLYTGAPIVDGQDEFLKQVRPLLMQRGAVFDYFEIDPDVFGEELTLQQNSDVDRFAAVALKAVVP